MTAALPSDAVALLIARAATAETLPAWLALARRLTVRELQAAVARVRPADGSPSPEPEVEGAAPPGDGGPAPPGDGGPAPPGDGGPAQPDDGATGRSPESASFTEAGDLEDCEDRSLVRVAAPRAVIAAFDEAIDLYRSVEGS